jgi:hypothetical protein
VSGGTAYNAASQTVTFTPSAALAAGTTYTATVSGARDTAGNLMAPTNWTFTTASATQPPPGCPCTIWPSTAAPTSGPDSDSGSVELGTRFRADVAGTVTGVRFYKQAGNTGTHVGRLWTATGTLLGAVTFSSETASGWQQANFATAIPITAGTTYVVTYFAPVGHYSADAGFFANAGVDRAPLHALGDGVDGPNGVYRYGTGGVFPTDTFQSTNYWVDAVLQTS